MKEVGLKGGGWEGGPKEGGAGVCGLEGEAGVWVSGGGAKGGGDEGERSHTT